jgi:uncharacterized DUF497 family protein
LISRESREARGFLSRRGDSLYRSAFDDVSRPGHSEGERRFITIGASQSGALLVIAHTEQDDTIRLISARRVTGHERKFYEEAKD